MDLDTINKPSEISKRMLEINPKIIISSIEDISNEAVQSELQSIDVKYVAMDECQVNKGRDKFY